MSLQDFDPFSTDYTANPKPWFEIFYREARVFHHPGLGAWFVHGYDEVRQILSHPEIGFNTNLIPGYEEASEERAKRWPVTERSRRDSGFSDPVKHARMRKLLAPDFKPSMIRRMAATVEDVARKRCEPMLGANEVDVVELIREIPLITISRILGLDEEAPGTKLFLEAAPAYFRGANPLSPDELRDETEQAAGKMLGVLSAEVEARRQQPREDLISQTLEFAREFDEITNEDIANLLVILVAAGTDTTRLASSLAIRTLIENPELRRTLAADRSLLDNAFFEFLRFDSPTKFLARITGTDVEVGGHTIPKGAFILPSPFAAGWDPEGYENASTFDPRRSPRGHLSFGLGEHYCLGVHLAKTQVGAILSFFLDHLTDEARVEHDGITWDPMNMFLREVTRMPIRLR